MGWKIINFLRRLWFGEAGGPRWTEPWKATEFHFDPRKVSDKDRQRILESSDGDVILLTPRQQMDWLMAGYYLEGSRPSRRLRLTGIGP